jgi:acyl dehydratase
MKVFNGVDELRACIGQELGVSSWFDVTQERIDEFARLTGDFQWIHVDPHASASSPLGGTIAHGLLTLSIGPKFSEEIFTLAGVNFALNYGYGKVRYPAPVPAGSRLRMRARLQGVDDVKGGAQFTVLQTFEIEGQEKPVCVAESLVRVYI